MANLKKLYLAAGCLTGVCGVILPGIMVTTAYYQADPMIVETLAYTSLSGIAVGVIGLIGCVLYNECYPNQPQYNRLESTPLTSVVVAPSQTATEPNPTPLPKSHGTFSKPLAPSDETPKHTLFL